MTDSDTERRESPKLGSQWPIFLACMAVIGFSLAFIRPVTHTPVGPSVFGPPTWIDRLWKFMTHPAMILLELVYVSVLFAKERRFWWRMLLAGLVGSFSGQLVHKLLLR